MEYSVVFNGRTVALKNYNVDVAEKIEKHIKLSESSTSVRASLQSLYNTISSLLEDSNVINELVGNFNDCDPNDLNILYTLIVDSYEKPLDDFEQNRSASAFDNIGVNKLVGIADSIEKIQKFSKKA